MRKHLTTVLLWSALAIPAIQNAQTKGSKSWLDLIQDKNASLYDIQKAFYADPENPFSGKTIAGKEEEQENGGYEQFKRYEYFASPRVYPSGNRSQLSLTVTEYQKYQQGLAQSRTGHQIAASNTWSYFNPTGIPVGAGAGRVNCVTPDPANPSILWLGTPDGGIWKSTNGGVNWTTNSDLFPDLGISDIAIQPGNSQIMYLATGDRDGYYTGGGGHVYTYGIMKSTDGGSTWTNISTMTITSNDMMSRLLIDPSNTQNIYAAGSFGIIKSTDAGASWNSIMPSGDPIFSMEFKPGNSSTIYAAGKGFYVSTDAGNTWSNSSTGLPSSTYRMSIGVTPANSAYVYILSADPSGKSINGVYRSTDAGLSFSTQMTGPPNLMGFNQDGSDGGVGQSFYTLTLGVSQTNANELMTGGVNMWKSTDGGATWGAQSITYWADTHTAADYVHADIHQILYTGTSSVLVGCDGGIFKTTDGGASWTDLCGDLQIGQLYGMGSSTSNPNYVISGWQDNGTNLMTGASTWNSALGGDGMLCFVDYSNDNNLWGEQYNASFNGSTDGGATWSSLPSPSSESTAWSTPWKQDPNSAGTILAGMTNLYSSGDGGNTWSMMGSQPDQSQNVNQFAVAPGNSQVIYVAKNYGLYKTINGGASWSTLNGLPADAVTYVAICPTNSNIVYVTLSGYDAGNKIYVSSDGGSTWTNYSTGLPNIPADCITYQKNSNGAVYAGMDVGVYYRDSTLSSWQPYMTGLPNVIVTQIDIYYPTGSLRASTYGRGIWQAPVYKPVATTPPTSLFSAAATTLCAGAGLSFTDHSLGTPTAWQWSFPGAGTTSSTAQNPSGIVYATAGTYSVTLLVTNGAGSNSSTQVITVAAQPTVGASGGITTCGGGSATLSATGASSYVWSPSTGLNTTSGSSVIASPGNTTTYTVTGTAVNGCSNTATTTMTELPLPVLQYNPTTPTICPSGNVSITVSGSGVVNYSWSPSTGLSATNTATVIASPSNTATYTVTGTDGNGCIGTTTVTVTVNQNPATPDVSEFGSLLSTSVTGVTYQWYLNGTLIPGATGQTYTGTVFPANYSVMVTNSGGCSSTSNSYAATGIHDLSATAVFQISPNPNNGVFDVYLNVQDAGEYELNLYNALGQKILSEKTGNLNGSYHKTFDLSKYGSGVYMISLSNSNHILVRKVLVN